MKTPDWQLAVLPSAPQYCGATPTEALPFLGNSLGSRLQTPCGSLSISAPNSQCRFRIHGSSNGGSFMNRCRLRTRSGPSNFRAIPSTFLRSASLKRPCSYNSNRAVVSLRPKVGPNKPVNSLSSPTTVSTSSTLNSHRDGSLGFHDVKIFFIHIL